MQNVKLALKGILVDEMSFRLNGVRIQNGGKVSLAPSFSRRVRRAADNEKLCFVSLTVKIENTAEAPKPFDLHVTMTGVFESDAASDEEKRETIVRATALLYPYLRSAVTNLTTAALTAPIVLPITDGLLFPEDAEPKTEPSFS